MLLYERSVWHSKTVSSWGTLYVLYNYTVLQNLKS